MCTTAAWEAVLGQFSTLLQTPALTLLEECEDTLAFLNVIPLGIICKEDHLHQCSQFRELWLEIKEVTSGVFTLLKWVL